MLIYRKHILKTMLPPLVMLSVILTSLVWITQVLRMVYLIDNGIELKHFFQLIILLVPSLLFMILPIIGLLTVIYVYNRLQQEKQLVVFRSSGLSNYDLAKPALLIAIGITIFAYYISAYLMPLSYNKMKQGLSDFRGGYVSNIISPRTFNQISRYNNIYVNKKNPDGSLEGIILFDDKVSSNQTIFFAKKAKIIVSDSNATEFELINGMRHSYDRFGNLTKLYFDDLIVAVRGGGTEIKERSKTSLELYIDEMLWPDDNLSPEKQQRHIIDGHMRIVWPLFNFVFIFLALSIFLNQPYDRKSRARPFIVTFIPILLIAYFHFTIQKIAYKDLNYIVLSYMNVFFCIIFSIWQSNRKCL